MATRVSVTRPVYTTTAVKPAAYVPGVYKSEYTDRLNKALDTVTNWKYDPLQDASYLALANVYAARGNIAAKNSMADAAALNGGYGTSNAVSAAQQARNQYNQQLAELIPGLESAAYEKASGTLSALRSADDTAYGRFRDTETDKQWQFSKEYEAYRDQVADDQWKYSQDMSEYQWGTDYNYKIDRDAVSDSQWQQNFDYQKQRDAVADQQWAQEYALKVQQQAASSGGSSGGGGGGGGSSKKSSSSSKKSSSSSSKKTTTTKVNPNIQAAQTKGKSTTAYYQKQTKSSSSSKKKSGGGGR